MRDDVAHLPDKKRRDLDRIVEVLFAEFEQATSLSTLSSPHRVVRGDC